MVYKQKGYRYRPGHGFRDVEAATIGQRVEAIKKKRGDNICSAADLVKDSEPEDSPLHTLFEWDDTVAGPKWREHEARQVLHSYEIVYINKAGKEHAEIANVSVADRKANPGGAYMATRDAMQDPDLRDRIIAQAKGMLDAWEKRYGHLEELAGYVAAIRKARAREQREQIQPQPVA